MRILRNNYLSWSHWLRIGDVLGDRAPRIFQVNWFRKGEDGRFLWPGFRENSRVLAWVLGRVEGTARAVETPVGLVPDPKDLDVTGLDLGPEAVRDLLHVDTDAWLAEVELTREWFTTFGDRLPAPVAEQLDLMERRLREAGADRG